MRRRVVGFQSTPPDGGRHAGAGLAAADEEVSIHAPGRGATALGEIGRMVRVGFNPRPRTGGDGIFGLISYGQNRFNPRPRTGGDASCAARIPSAGSFNPRPRTGGDWTPRSTFAPSVSFQSTPPDGGRRKSA